MSMDMFQQHALAVKKVADGIWGCIRRSVGSRLREGDPSPLLSTWSAVCSSGLHSMRKTWSYWRESDEWPQR